MCTKAAFRLLLHGLIRVTNLVSFAVHSYIASGRPFFGICIGMQCLFETSEEAPGSEVRPRCCDTN